jgi:hypothetical protein
MNFNFQKCFKERLNNESLYKWIQISFSSEFLELFKEKIEIPEIKSYLV